MKYKIAGLFLIFGTLVGCGAAGPQPYHDRDGNFCEYDDIEPGDRGYFDQNGMFCERDEDDD